MRLPIACRAALVATMVAQAATPVTAGPPSAVVDLATVGTASDLLRAHGSAGVGSFGVPVAGGFDCDDDGADDVAVSGGAVRTPLAALFPGACAASDTAALAACAAARARCRFCESLNGFDDLAANCDAFDDAAPNSSCGAA